jgi:conjugal transfer pilus assembly protein TraV
MSGLDGATSYGCKAPAGVQCDSVSGTYHNALQNNLPSQRRSPTQDGGAMAAPTAWPRRADVQTLTTAAGPVSANDVGTSASPLRAAPRVLRLWIKPWEDADHDLNGESHVYVQVDNGRWLLDHVQHQAREAYAPVRAGRTTAAPTKSSGQAGADKSSANASIDDATPVTEALRALRGRNAPGIN